MNIKQLTATIPYELFNNMVIANNLNNQDEVDAYITDLIERDITYQQEVDMISRHCDTVIELKEVNHE